MGDIFKTLQTSQVLEKMEQIEKDTTIHLVNDVENQWESRWIKLKFWLESYGE